MGVRTHLLLLCAALAVCSSPEQIHLALGHNPSEVVVSWITPHDAPSTVLYGTTSGNLDMTVHGVVTQYTANCVGNFTPSFNYTSGIIHHARLTGLREKTPYFYRVGDPSSGDLSSERSFETMPPVGDKDPFSFAFIGDLGQTNYSQITVQHLQDDPDLRVILHAGDMAYADCDQPRWDSWGRMIDPLAAERPWMVCPGNHEIETDPLHKTTFTAYKHRFVMPEYRPTNDSTTVRQLPDSCAPSVYTGDYNYGNSFYSVDIASMHFIALNSYTATSTSSPQYRWLEADLAAVDRARTPWIVIIVHSPWYNSNFCHYNESNTVAMRDAMEPLVMHYGVNLIVAGHVHAYERTLPVYKDVPTHGAPMYIVVGDGGNREGHCPFYHEPKPIWSAYRNGTEYGHVGMELVNSTHAHIQWYRNVDTEFVSTDDFWLLNTHAKSHGRRRRVAH